MAKRNASDTCAARGRLKRSSVPRPASAFGCGTDLSAMRMHDRARDVEAQPQSAEAAPGVLIGLEEAVEDDLGLVGSDADARVQDAHLRSVRRRAGADRHRAAVR